MKRICAVFLAIALMMLLAGCQTDNRTPLEKAIDSMPTADPAEVAALSEQYDRDAARRNGDTYCEKCGKISEGKVRLCPFCGEYVSAAAELGY